MGKFILWWFFIFAAATTGCREKTPAIPTENTTMEWREESWDFGILVQGEEVSHTFRFRNTGEHALVIKKVETGCGCTVANYEKTPVKPGKEGKLEIVFNSMGRMGKQYKEIRIFANIPGQETIVRFTAQVRE